MCCGPNIHNFITQCLRSSSWKPMRFSRYFPGLFVLRMSFSWRLFQLLMARTSLALGIMVHFTNLDYRSFNNYVDQIKYNFYPHPPLAWTNSNLDILHNIYPLPRDPTVDFLKVSNFQNEFMKSFWNLLTFIDPLPPSSCPRSYWMPPYSPHLVSQNSSFSLHRTNLWHPYVLFASNWSVNRVQ